MNKLLLGNSQDLSPSEVGGGGERGVRGFWGSHGFPGGTEERISCH